MTRRFWTGAALALPLLLGEMGGHLFGCACRSPTDLELDPARAGTPVVLWAGAPFFARGWASLKNRNLNMFTLIALGVGVAWGYSLFAVLAPGLIPHGFRSGPRRRAGLFRACGGDHRPGAPGQVLELRARERTSGAIRALLRSRRTRRGACAPTAPTRRSRSTGCWPATGSAYAPATRCRSTAWCWRVTPRSTSRW
jgi:Cu+-exporting ATPase